MKKFFPLLFIGTVLLFFELIVRSSFYIYPTETYQKYFIKKKPPGHMTKIFGTFSNKFNGSGAIGDVYKGQPFKIAFLGSSDLSGVYLSFKKNPTEQIKSLLEPDNVHIDNFSIPSMGVDAIIWQMKSLYRKGRYYDIIVCGVDELREGFFQDQFANRWIFISGTNPIAFTIKLKQFFDRSKPRELFFKLFNSVLIKKIKESIASGWKSITTGLMVFATDLNESANHQENNTPPRTKETEILLKRSLRGEYITDNEFNTRLQPEITSKLIYRDIKDINKSHITTFSEQDLMRIKKWANKIADKIYFVPSQFAWHPSMLPSYKNIYSIIQPDDNFNINRPRFHDTKTMYNIYRYKAYKLMAMVKKLGIESLPYKESLFNTMPYIEGLFVDEFHLTEKGATVAAHYFAKKFAPLVESKLKIKIDKTRFTNSFKDGYKR